MCGLIFLWWFCSIHQCRHALGWAGCSCCCSLTWHPENVGSRPEILQLDGQPGHHQHSSETAALKVQVSKEAVCDTLLVCVMPAFKLYETSFNNFVRYRNCPRWTKAFYIDVCVIKDFWYYCRVVCNHPAISCSIWCHSYIRTTILQLVYSGTVVRQADWI